MEENQDNVAITVKKEEEEEEAEEEIGETLEEKLDHTSNAFVDVRPRYFDYGSIEKAIQAEDEILLKLNGDKSKEDQEKENVWVDPWCGDSLESLGDFLYHDCSILPPGATPPELVRWCRINGRKEILGCSSPRIFAPEGRKSSQIVQGRLANAWFINAVGLLAGDEKKGVHCLKKCIVSDRHFKTHGILTLRFWKEGKWIYVHIDDRIPCDASMQPLYSKCKDPNETFILILEKAYAKLHGSYLNLENGEMRDALADLTGGVIHTIEKNWHALESSVQTNSNSTALVIGAQIKSDNKSTKKRSDGLLVGWTYLVAGVYVPLGSVKLVKLINIWGKSTWKGRWSKNDPEWANNKAIKEELNPDDEWPIDEFYISWDEFEKTFSEIVACTISTTESAEWKKATFHGKFQAESIMSGAGGNPNNELDWLKNPMIGFSINDTTTVGFTFRQARDERLHDFFDLKEDRGFLCTSSSSSRTSDEEHTNSTNESGDQQRDTKRNNSGLGLLICRIGSYKCGRRRINHLTSKCIMSHSGTTFTNSRQVSCFVSALAKGDYAIIPCTYDSDVFGEFCLDVFSADDSCPLDFHVSPNDDLTQALNELAADADESDDEDEQGKSKTKKLPLPKFVCDPNPYQIDDKMDHGALEAIGVQSLLVQVFDNNNKRANLM